MITEANTIDNINEILTLPHLEDLSLRFVVDDPKVGNIKLNLRKLKLAFEVSPENNALLLDLISKSPFLTNLTLERLTYKEETLPLTLAVLSSVTENRVISIITDDGVIHVCKRNNICRYKSLESKFVLDLDLKSNSYKNDVIKFVRQEMPECAIIE